MQYIQIRMLTPTRISEKILFYTYLPFLALYKDRSHKFILHLLPTALAQLIDTLDI